MYCIKQIPFIYRIPSSTHVTYIRKQYNTTYFNIIQLPPQNILMFSDSLPLCEYSRKKMHLFYSELYTSMSSYYYLQSLSYFIITTIYTQKLYLPNTYIHDSTIFSP